MPVIYLLTICLLASKCSRICVSLIRNANQQKVSSIPLEINAFYVQTLTLDAFFFVFISFCDSDNITQCNQQLPQSAAIVTRGGVENTMLEAKAKDTKKLRSQGQGQPFRGQTLSRPRTGMLEAKNKDQGQKRKCSPKKKGLRKFFQAISKFKKKGLQKFFQAFSSKKRLLKFFFRRSAKFQQSKKKCCPKKVQNFNNPKKGQFSRT